MKLIFLEDPMIVTMINAGTGGVIGILFSLAFLCIVAGIGSVIPHDQYSATSNAVRSMGNYAIPAMVLGSVIGSVLGGVVGIRRSK